MRKGFKLKIQFEVVNTQVEALFCSGLQDDETVDERLCKIEEFISCCGWDPEEFELYRKYGALN